MVMTGGVLIGLGVGGDGAESIVINDGSTLEDPPFNLELIPGYVPIPTIVTSHY